MADKTEQGFFYKAHIMRDGERVIREGVIHAKFPLDALDGIVKLSTETWRRPLTRIELYELGAGGELVATTTVNDRIDAVVKTHKILKTGKFKTLIDNREERKNVTRVTKPKASEEPVKANEYLWAANVGTRMYLPTFTVSGEFK